VTPEWRSYLIINGLQWLLVALIGTVVHLQFGVSWIVVVVVVLAWIGKDLASYPLLRHYYRSEAPAQRMFGLRGVTLSPLTPRGLVRVRGEIWQAETQDPAHDLAEGTHVYVRDVRGLVLYVEAIDDDVI
jgi:membrane-bound serine protease (ClpP class)